MIYPWMISEVVVANVSRGGAAQRVLRELGLPTSALLLVDRNGEAMASRRRSSIFLGENAARRSSSVVVPAASAAGGLLLPTASDWWSAVGVSCNTPGAVQAWDDTISENELEAFGASEEWTLLKFKGNSDLKAEWRHVPDSKFRLHRISMVLEGVAPKAALQAMWESLGTPGSIVFGDRSVLDQRSVLCLDAKHQVLAQSTALPRGVSNRVFCCLTSKHEDKQLITNTHIELDKYNLQQAVPETNDFVVGKFRNYSMRFQDTADGDCKVTALNCVDPKGSLLSALANNDRVSVAIAKGVRGMFRSIEAQAKARQQHGFDDGEEFEEQLPRPRRASVAPTSASNPLATRFDPSVLPQSLGGILKGPRCAEVSHSPISETVGRATLLRTFRDVAETEVRDVGAIISALRTEHEIEVSTLLPHVGGEVVLLQWLRDQNGDVGAAVTKVLESLRLRSDKYNADEIHAEIVDAAMSFSEVPGNTKLQRVWPHNMNLGRARSGDVVRYERWGSIDIAGVLRDFPLLKEKAESDGGGEQLSKIGADAWAQALESDAECKLDSFLAKFDTDVRTAVDELLRLEDALGARFIASSTSDTWATLPGAVIPTEYRHVAGSNFRQFRFRTELPREVDGVEVTAEEWFTRAVETLSTTESFSFGDRSVLDQQVLGWLDETHHVGRQVVSMPRGVSDREFLTIALVDHDSCTFTNKSLEGRAVTSLADTVENTGLVRAKMILYGFRIEPPSDPLKGCQFVGFEHFEPLGGVPPAVVNLDLVGRARAKGVRGMARSLGRALLKPVHTGLAVGDDEEQGVGVTFQQNLTYRSELLSMLLDRTSREQHRVTYVVAVYDMSGAKADLRRLVPHLKESYAISDAISVPSSVILASAVNSVVATLWGGVSRIFPESTRASVCRQ